MASNMRPEDMLPLTPAMLHILLALADGEKHGYAIMKEVEKISNGVVTIGTGTLYVSIHKLIEQRLIEEIDNRPGAPKEDVRRRYYYRITNFGSRVLNAEISRLESLTQVYKQRRPLEGEA